MTKADFYEYLEQSFDSYIKKVIKSKSIDIIREYTRKAKREISLSDISLSDINSQANFVDTYQLYYRDYIVRNFVVRVCDPVIGELLQHLTPQRREVILLYYFLDLNDVEIGNLLQIDNTTVKYRRKTALKYLKRMMEDSEDD